jgi:predicted DNA-binding protein (MmcQ/YjbR family)
MTHEQFNAFCKALPATTYVMQWGGSHVWKVGGKVFAIGVVGDEPPAFTFKVTPMAFEVFKRQPGLRPAPYLASRGMKWIQHYAKPGLPDRELKEMLRHSYTLVIAGLPKTMRAALGLSETAAPPSASHPR